MKLKIFDLNDNYQQFLDKQGFIAINFPIKNSIKIYRDYEKLKNKDKLKIEIENILGRNDSILNSSEALEIFLVYSYYWLKKSDNLIIFTAGLSYTSIDYYIKTMEAILDKMNGKTLYIVKNYLSNEM